MNCCGKAWRGNADVLKVPLHNKVWGYVDVAMSVTRHVPAEI